MRGVIEDTSASSHGSVWVADFVRRREGRQEYEAHFEGLANPWARSPEAEAEAAISTSGGGHGSRRLFRIPSSAAIKTHVLKDHHASLQVDCRFGSQTTLASLASLYVCCPL
jgi:hypothetical protein